MMNKLVFASARVAAVSLLITAPLAPTFAQQAPSGADTKRETSQGITGTGEWVPAEVTKEAPTIPVERASFHIPVFDNKYVTVMRVFVPAGTASDYHTHIADQISVVTQAYPQKAYSQILGADRGHIRGAPTGEMEYLTFPTPKSHRVVNPDTIDMNLTVTALKGSAPFGFDVPARPATYVQTFDKPRARGWRLILKPGESAPAIKQGGPGLRIIISGRELTEVDATGHARKFGLRSGDSYWQQAGATREVRNTGAVPLELVELELK